MTATVFPVYNKFYTLAVYLAVVLLLSLLCFGSLKDHLFFTHDNEIKQDYPRLTADPAFFFSPNKATVSGRPIDELVTWRAAHPKRRTLVQALFRHWGRLRRR